MGPLAEQWAARYVPESDMRVQLADAVVGWEPLPTAGVARSYLATLDDGRTVTLGFITSMSHPFCDRCDRIRITADGSFYPCLMDRPAANLLPAVRPVFRAAALDELLCTGLNRKADLHPASGHSAMIGIGG
jgi:GTP 3',8-cyclase